MKMERMNQKQEAAIQALGNKLVEDVFERMSLTLDIAGMESGDAGRFSILAQMFHFLLTGLTMMADEDMKLDTKVYIALLGAARFDTEMANEWFRRCLDRAPPKIELLSDE